ncbi:GntR family transcriptional regulator [Natronocella acetinitrilica]|uniref:GntR family transcriptional regulator n=1 Tax=Natronocella acetinitrilica TaxID=414046 RepID=A0AAE3G6X6_9GAMM|nr:GntR family transcriptional regulator [Natronocella acetinitrilica]MCP1676951.1 GntR family transcriptional regulator [Natronocella acetinitrilica]
MRQQVSKGFDMRSSGEAVVPIEKEVDRLALFQPADWDSAAGKPLYRLVEDEIRRLINNGSLIPGDLIPSEPQLAKAMSVSPGTVKKAIDNLVWEKLLFRHQGKGTYVSKINFRKSLFRFFTYGDAEGQPVRIHKETTARGRHVGSDDVCRRLNVKEGSDLVYIERVGFIEDKPILVEYSWWPAHVVPGLEDERVHIPDYLYALVFDKYGVPVIRAEETLTASAADAKTAQMIDVEEGTPVVVLKRTTYTRGNRIVEVRTTKGRADRFSYKTEIR